MSIFDFSLHVFNNIHPVRIHQSRNHQTLCHNSVKLFSKTVSGFFEKLADFETSNCEQKESIAGAPTETNHIFEALLMKHLWKSLIVSLCV